LCNQNVCCINIHSTVHQPSWYPPNVQPTVVLLLRVFVFFSPYVRSLAAFFLPFDVFQPEFS
jgi:hypothetical protein